MHSSKFGKHHCLLRKRSASFELGNVVGRFQFKSFLSKIPPLSVQVAHWIFTKWISLKNPPKLLFLKQRSFGWLQVASGGFPFLRESFLWGIFLRWEREYTEDLSERTSGDSKSFWKRFRWSESSSEVLPLFLPEEWEEVLSTFLRGQSFWE